MGKKMCICCLFRVDGDGVRKQTQKKLFGMDEIFAYVLCKGAFVVLFYLTLHDLIQDAISYGIFM